MARFMVLNRCRQKAVGKQQKVILRNIQEDKKMMSIFHTKKTVRKVNLRHVLSFVLAVDLVYISSVTLLRSPQSSQAICSFR